MHVEGMLSSALLAMVLLAPAAEPQSQTDRQRAAASRAAGWRASLPRQEIDEFGGDEVQSVDFLTRHVGWAVGHGTTMILHTTDGGKSWERLPLFDGEEHGRSFESVRFWDARHGWIVGWKELLWTSNGGETWEPVQGADYVYGRVLLPLSPSVVMVGSKDGRISVTSADGTKLEPLGKPDDRPINELALVEPNRFFAVVGEGAGNYGAIFVSVDGGMTWEVAAEGDKPLFSIAFSEDGRGVAVGDNVAYWSDDAGESWHRVAVMGTRYAARFLGEQAVVAVGTTPGVSLSRDGGKTWRPIVGPPERYHLVDIDAVDPGWWFVAGGYGVEAIYHRVDTAFRDEIARSRLPIPAAIRLPGGRTLPAGMYDVSLSHHGDEHVLELERTGPPPDSAASASSGTDGVADCDPCVAELPVDVEYVVEDETSNSREEPRFWVSLEPTATGAEIVLDIVVSPPRDAAIALAALGAGEEAEVSSAVAVRRSSQAASTGGSLFGRLKKAAEGDLRGAVADAPIDPKAIRDRVTSAKSSPPAVYHLRVRHPIELFGAGESGSGEGSAEPRR